MYEASDPVVDMLLTSRVQLMFEMPWFGNLIARLEMVDASDWCRTAATDGRRFYYNREFIKKLKPEELLFLNGHEVLHCVLDHLKRRGRMHPKRLNMAQDYIINYMLKKAKCGKMPEGGLYDPRFTDEMSSEEVYEILEKESVTITVTLDEHIYVEGDEDDDRDGEGGGGGNGDGSEGGGRKVEVTITGRGGKPKLTEEEYQKIRADIRSSVIMASQLHGTDKLPVGLKRMVDELISPKLDWRTLLDAHIRSAFKADYTMQKLSRKSLALYYNEQRRLRALESGEWHPELERNRSLIRAATPLLPSRGDAQKIDLMVFIDCSGSETEQMIREQLSETKGIMLTFPDFIVRVATFDDDVYNYKVFTPANIDEIDRYEIKGGGGTNFPAMFEFMKRMGLTPHRLVVFTDGLPAGNNWGDPNYCPTLFVLHAPKNIVAPYGITTYYEFKNAA